MSSHELVIYGGLFVGILLLVQATYFAVFGRAIDSNRRVNRRLEMLEKGAGREQVLEQLRKEMGRHAGAVRLPLYGMLAEKARKANLSLTPAQILLLMAAVGAAAFAALTFGTAASLPVRAGVAVAAGAGGVYFWISKKAAKRITMIEEQLPDAVELMVRSLRVGHPFSSAIGIVAREAADPLGTEMGIVADETAYGRDMGESLRALSDRVGIQDLRFLAVAVAIQQQSGGNLAEILDGLAKVIRARFKLFRRVRAITAEAKWSGVFLSGFPLVALVGINLLQPGYYDDVKETAVFLPACFVVGGLLTANIFVMRALVNIKV